MSLITIRIIECDGRKCMSRAEVDTTTRQARHILRKQNKWVRVRRGQSMVDLCEKCARAPGGEAGR